MNDYIVRATAADDCIRLFAATTANLVQSAHDAHNTSNVATAALGRLLTGGVIMGSMLKNETDVMTLQIECAGPIKGMTVTVGGEKDNCIDAKGYVINPDVELPLKENGKLDVAEHWEPDF